MLVTLHQYKHEEVDIDDERTRGESQTEDTVDKGPEEYFGGDLDLDAATWETVEYRGDPVQRRELSLDEVTAVSVQSDAESDAGSGDPDLPGTTVQVRRLGHDEQFTNASLVEAEDREP